MFISAWIAIPLLVAWAIYDDRNRRKRAQLWAQERQETFDRHAKEKQEIIDQYQKLSVWRYRLAAEVKRGKISIEALAAVDYWMLHDTELSFSFISDFLDECDQEESIKTLVDHAYDEIARDCEGGIAEFGKNFRSLAR